MNVLVYPKVNIVIPTYGGSDSLSKSIESALMQNYPNFKVIVVDDNNPCSEARHKTEKIISTFQDNEHLIYIKHPTNKNGAAARNTGAFSIQSDYLCFLDDDDVFLQNRVLHSVQYLENHKEYDACYCWRTQNGKEVCGKRTGDLSDALLDLSFTPYTSALTIRTEAYYELKGFDESYRRHQDFEFLLRFFKNYDIGVVEEILVEIVGNEIDNQPKGIKMYELKEKFFEQFGSSIDEIDSVRSGYKKHAYAAHFAAAGKELLRNRKFVLFIKMYIKYGYKGRFEFWTRLFNYMSKGIKKMIKRHTNSGKV